MKNKKQSNLSNQNSKTSNLNLSLKAITTWLSFIAIPPPPVSGSSRQLIQFLRIFSLLFVLIVHFTLVVHVFLNARNVSLTYTRGISTTASSWNFIIDNINWAMYVVGGHVFLLFLTRPKTWTDLINSFNLLEDNLKTPDILSKCRRVSVQLIVYIICSVRIKFVPILVIIN